MQEHCAIPEHSKLGGQEVSCYGTEKYLCLGIRWDLTVSGRECLGGKCPPLLRGGSTFFVLEIAPNRKKPRSDVTSARKHWRRDFFLLVRDNVRLALVPS